MNRTTEVTIEGPANVLTQEGGGPSTYGGVEKVGGRDTAAALGVPVLIKKK